MDKDGICELRDASAIWGKDTYQTKSMLRKELQDEKAKIACIGQADERIVKISSIMNGRAGQRAGAASVR